ncbi:tRNA uracil 4-sulfurtransferase ThiI [Limnochorda pilosa]|uniref:Probable tRNA sulfurtransferase n=1 Tax=Limnochorda pilosa TaxID=1555112 RepID=A0A0K2SKC0_LIMPI|nr:tRNA uracil 4-sulfurtransferase ThiI [Limnochorda pilosa]BAS27563.1 thiamine biosynthesis protein ThiI [Limnochorda pilosa]
MRELILVRYGEIGLKGENRPHFEHRLAANLRRALEDLPDARVERGYGRLFVDPACRTDEALARLRRVFGVVGLHPSVETPLETEAILDAALRLVRGERRPARFKVEARRSNKAFPLDSIELNRKVGAHLLEHLDGLSVDLRHPEVRLRLEIRERHAYLYVRDVPGPGGLPVGVASPALLLLSGGIDSPVAGWYTMKRGVPLSAVHFQSPPFTSPRALQKVQDLCDVLAAWGGPVRLHTVPFTRIQTAIRKHVPPELGITVMRRMMFRIAERLAARDGLAALVTGESLGQVASQTLESLAAINDVVRLPVLRPLIGLDKSEIIDRAQAIGTYAISIRPYEDCCTLFVPAHPATHPDRLQAEAAEAALAVQALVGEAVAGTEVEERRAPGDARLPSR